MKQRCTSSFSLWACGSLAAFIASSALTGWADPGDVYGSEVVEGALYEVDPITADPNLIGPLGQIINGLAYDVNHDVLYGISAGADAIYTINRATGRATIIGNVGSLGYDNANGLAYDPNRDVLYGTDNNTNALFTVDVNTGIAHEIGVISGGFREIEGLAYDPFNEILYGITQLDRRIVAIDVDTAEAVPVSDLLPEETWRGLTYDTDRRVVYATQVAPWSGGLRGLWKFVPDTGEFSLIGDMVDPPAMQGLAYVPENSWIRLRAVGECPDPIQMCILGGQPGDRVAIAYGTSAGSTGPVPGCPDLLVDIRNARVAVTGRVGADGTFCRQGRIPPKWCDRLLFQAVDIKSCQKSIVVRK